jgi:hypothetical protein
MSILDLPTFASLLLRYFAPILLNERLARRKFRMVDGSEIKVKMKATIISGMYVFIFGIC